MTTVYPVAFDATYFLISSLTLVVVLAIFKYVSPFLSRVIFPELRTLPDSTQIYWHTCMCSTLHATAVSSMCVYALYYETQLKEDPIWGQSSLVRCSCAIVIGYLAADSLLMIIYYKEIGDIFYVLHHWASVYAYYYVMCYGVYSYFANFRLMAEFSTFWVNNRWMLATMDMKSTNVYFWNGCILTAVFFLCRILSMPPCWYMIYTIYGTDSYHRSGSAKYVLIISCFVLDVLNFKWFHKLVIGVIKQVSHKTDANRNLTAQKEE